MSEEAPERVEENTPKEDAADQSAPLAIALIYVLSEIMSELFEGLIDD